MLAAREEAYEKRVEEARATLETAVKLAGDAKVAEAWKVWRDARDVMGEAPELERVAAVIREVEAKLREKEELEAVLDLLGRDASAGSEAERLEILEKAAAEAKRFLTAYPDSRGKEEVGEGLAYAERELAIQQSYVEALAKARSLFSERRFAECIAECDRALAVRDGEEPKEVRTRALEALTPEGMVFVPAGFFQKGRHREPTHLEAFYVDRTEVTNEAYARFVEETGHAAPSGWKDDRFPAGQGEHPVVNVTLDDALAFAAWAGKRLPTEVEWERAARGTDGRAYPWGDEWDSSKGHFGPKGTVPVGSMPFDRSPVGAMDMGGNVMELTLPADAPADGKGGAVAKGGHWSDDFHPPYALTFNRWPVDRKHKDATTGFRCVRTARP